VTLYTGDLQSCKPMQHQAGVALAEVQHTTSVAGLPRCTVAGAAHEGSH
jgi:hypothetical protein